MPIRSTKSAAMFVTRRLLSAGYHAYFAGGCVRDMLLGLRAGDYDIATDATPEQIKCLFRRVLMVGAKFGVAVVMKGDQQIEVATFRSDVSYSDGRRPDEIRYSSPKEDALRRDFTINGMFYDPISDEVIDYVGGREDLSAQIIRTIGLASLRFAEDYLRMLRGVRFTVRFDFAMDNDTATEIIRNADHITAISGERIFDELSKMLAGPNPSEALKLLNKLDLAKYILPELFDRNNPASSSNQTLWNRAVKRVAEAYQVQKHRRQKYLTLACCLAELSTNAIEKIVRRWGASNDLRKKMCWVGANLELLGDMNLLPLPDFKRMIANRNFQLLKQVWRVQEQMQTGKITASRALSARINKLNPALINPLPLITGSDLFAIGFVPGPFLGNTLDAIRDAQLAEKICSRADALTQAKTLLNANDEHLQ